MVMSRTSTSAAVASAFLASSAPVVLAGDQVGRTNTAETSVGFDNLWNIVDRGTTCYYVGPGMKGKKVAFKEGVEGFELTDESATSVEDNLKAGTSLVTAKCAVFCGLDLGDQVVTKPMTVAESRALLFHDASKPLSPRNKAAFAFYKNFISLWQVDAGKYAAQRADLWS